MATVDQLLAQADELNSALSTQRKRLSHASSYSARLTIIRRIRYLEDQLDAIYRRYMRALGSTGITVYGTTKKPRVQAGLSVQMDVSIDGRFYSNPSPKIAHSHRVWVRSQIDIAQKSPFSTVKTEIPELIRCTWVIPRGWTSLDIYGRFGRIEYVGSLPLIVTREFRAPASGSTKAKFGMYADPYYMDDPKGLAPAESSIESGEVTCTLEAGRTYYIYARTSNVFSARTTISGGISFLVDDDADTLFYTDGGYYVTARLITTGARAGNYIETDQDGVDLNEVLSAT